MRWNRYGLGFHQQTKEKRSPSTGYLLETDSVFVLAGYLVSESLESKRLGFQKLRDSVLLPACQSGSSSIKE